MNMRFAGLYRVMIMGCLSLFALDAKADLSSKQARKLITRMAGFELPNDAVRVKNVSMHSDSAASATAELQAIFRLEKDDQWRIVELRTGSDRWDSVELFTRDGKWADSFIRCHVPEMSIRGQAEPGTKRSRCLIAALFELEVPTDQVRIKSISTGLSLASRPSALVETLVRLDFMFSRQGKEGWSITGVKLGHRDWVEPAILFSFSTEWKKLRARQDLEATAEALEKFRRERLVYVASDSHAVLVDHLSPRYLSRVIRVDPWHEPYLYQGTRDSYTLRSLGSDRKENTADDIVVTGPSK